MKRESSPTGMPRSALPRDPDGAEGVIWGLAIGIAALFAVGQIATVLAMAPGAVAFYRGAATAPGMVSVASTLGWPGILLGLVLLDTAILGLCLWLARRYWVGIAFLPPVLYLGIGSITLWLLVSQALAQVLQAR